MMPHDHLNCWTPLYLAKSPTSAVTRISTWRKRVFWPTHGGDSWRSQADVAHQVRGRAPRAREYPNINSVFLPCAWRLPCRAVHSAHPNICASFAGPVQHAWCVKCTLICVFATVRPGCRLPAICCRLPAICFSIGVSRETHA